MTTWIRGLRLWLHGWRKDNVVLVSSQSGRVWGVSVDVIGGREEVSVVELDPVYGSPLR